MIFAFVIFSGLCFGSFITLASWRLPRGGSVVRPPSQCTACGATLGGRDLVPVLSWALAGGKCRGCGVGVHWRYPAIELATAALFVGAYLVYGATPLGAVVMLAAVALMLMVVVDFEHYLIPDPVHVSLAVLAVPYVYFSGGTWMNAGIGMGLSGGLALMLHYGYRYLRKREGLGFGDVKFFTVAGAWTGVMDFPVFILLSGVLGVLLGIGWRLARRGEYFPFGPALAAALFICILRPGMLGL